MKMGSSLRPSAAVFVPGGSASTAAVTATPVAVAAAVTATPARSAAPTPATYDRERDNEDLDDIPTYAEELVLQAMLSRGMTSQDYITAIENGSWRGYLPPNDPHYDPACDPDRLVYQCSACEEEADFECENCQQLFCEMCDSQVHSTVANRFHVRFELASSAPDAGTGSPSADAAAYSVPQATYAATYSAPVPAAVSVIPPPGRVLSAAPHGMCGSCWEVSGLTTPALWCCTECTDMQYYCNDCNFSRHQPRPMRHHQRVPLGPAPAAAAPASKMSYSGQQFAPRDPKP
jgi:hypothetical protein